MPLALLEDRFPNPLVPRAEAVGAVQAYLDQAGRLACEAAPTGSGFRCTVIAKGHDMAEILALSGLATAAPDAPENVRRAEREARQNQAGISRPH